MTSSASGLFATLVDRRLGRYDLALAAIPLSFLLAGVAGLALSVPPRLALTAAAVGAVVVADSLFLTPPTPTRGESATPARRRRCPVAGSR